MGQRKTSPPTATRGETWFITLQKRSMEMDENIRVLKNIPAFSQRLAETTTSAKLPTARQFGSRPGLFSCSRNVNLCNFEDDS
ncbi:hypothetical protein SK128_022338, partial [Halocaridina rubra]